jgi:hypothetical protein
VAKGPVRHKTGSVACRAEDEPTAGCRGCFERTGHSPTLSGARQQDGNHRAHASRREWHTLSVRGRGSSFDLNFLSARAPRARPGSVSLTVPLSVAAHLHLLREQRAQWHLMRRPRLLTGLIEIRQHEAAIQGIIRRIETVGDATRHQLGLQITTAAHREVHSASQLAYAHGRGEAQASLSGEVAAKRATPRAPLACIA